MKLLVVDDDRSVLAALATMMRVRRPHWSAEYVCDPHEALQKLITQKYDAVLSDLHMPHLDGVSMLRQARKLPSQTPFVFLSGYSAQYAAAAWDSGAFAIIDKPIPMTLLLETLDAAMSAH